MNGIKPTTKEVKDWLLASLRHSCQVEYYLHELGLRNSDPQRPHDIVGQGNKYSWPVISGMAVQHRSRDARFFEEYVLPSIELHRKGQYHHQVWNQAHRGINHEGMKKLCAVDALCSLLDDRPYQGGRHTFEQMIPMIKKNEPERAKWFWMVYSQMKGMLLPDIQSITSLQDFPNIGIPKSTYEISREHTLEAVLMLRKERGYKDLN